jgi:hypothetical protein
MLLCENERCEKDCKISPLLKVEKNMIMTINSNYSSHALLIFKDDEIVKWSGKFIHIGGFIIKTYILEVN